VQLANWNWLGQQVLASAAIRQLGLSAIEVPLFDRVSRVSPVLICLGLLAGCVSTVLDVENKADQPIPAPLRAEMTRRGMSPAGPLLIRIFKHESELEVWKRDADGRYSLLKNYPICRWAGELGPKKKEGDRQAPEGFYHVSAGMLNPASEYYLSFNLGYPNRLERTLGYTGDALMVHGACTSAGCFALTDQGISEIFAVAREALEAGQEAFQVQSFPFRMTPENMAAHAGHPDFQFWQNLKEGYDRFELTRLPPNVTYCEGRYVFDAARRDDRSMNPLAACRAGDEIEAALVSERVETIGTDQTVSVHAYADGGMHPRFRRFLETEGADALARRTSLTGVSRKPAGRRSDRSTRCCALE
jgi:murein L,D-transpeptidase YafK